MTMHNQVCLGPYFMKEQVRGQTYSVTFVIEISHLTNWLHSNFAHKFFPYDNAYSSIFIGSNFNREPRTKTFFYIFNWNHASNEPILIKLSPQVLFLMTMHIGVFSAPNFNRHSVNDGKFFCVFDWNDAFNEPILLFLHTRSLSITMHIQVLSETYFISVQNTRRIFMFANEIRNLVKTFSYVCN